jgi:FkbM family methyltransferase
LGASKRVRYNFRAVNLSYSDAEIAELVSEFTDPQAREATELASLAKILIGTSHFIDVGANVGQYIFHAAKHLHNARLVAIEANPLLIPALTTTVENLRRDESSGNEYEITPAAVSDLAGTLEFYVSKYPTLSSVFPNGGAVRVTVPTVNLDDFYRPSARTVVKIDVEGAEYRAIRSGSRFLRSEHTSFFVELHSWGDQTIGKYPLQVCWLFLQHGYALRKIGTHYLFYKGPWFTRTSSFVGECPALGLKYLVCRYWGNLAPLLNRLRRKMQRFRNRK